jgi:hypothetical protein
MFLKELFRVNFTIGLFVWLISHQPAVLFSQSKPATSNQPTVLFSHNKSAPAISHQPNEQAELFPKSHLGPQSKKQSSRPIYFSQDLI